MKDKGVRIENNWTKPSVKKLQLFKGVIKLIKEVSTSDWLSVSSSAIDTIEAIKLDDKPGKIGWKLVSRALIDSILNLITENKTEFCKEEIVVDHLDEQLNKVLESEEYFLEVDFFENPHSLLIIQEIRPILKDFLLLFSFSAIEVENIINRLPTYFVFSLINEWRKNYKYYQVLKDVLLTPFDEAAKKENEWLLYSNWINRQVEGPVFSESFSLSQIYIPLRASFKKREQKDSLENSLGDILVKKKEPTRIAIDLEKELLEWLRKGDKEDALRVIRGGPGYGKSTFLKMLASILVNKGRRVLFIPLHRFEVREDLTVAVQSFLKYDGLLTFDPFEEERLVLLFDGLDELSMQGTTLSDVANQFIREIEKKLSNYNSRKIKLQVIISGRDVVVQQNEAELRKEGQIISLLPYYLTEKEREEYIDEKKLLAVDQRILWWKKYGLVRGKGYKDLPAGLKKQELDEVTSQPLLNYLVALSFERGKIDFSKNTNLNEIYNDLLEAVYFRNYAEGRTHYTLRKLELSGFIRMLEEIAIAAWHGNGRTTTVSEIEKHFYESGMVKLLDNFIKDAEKGVVSLLAAFYFRQAGQNVAGAQTFEFTHKSFGEYLTARRITNKLFLIKNKIEENEGNFDEGWNIKTSLVEWIKLFGAKDIDADLIKFIVNELQLKFEGEPAELQSCQVLIIKLINHVLREGMPFEKIDPRPSYNLEYSQATNCEKALLILLSCVAELTGTVSNINWPSPTSFGEWLGRVAAQRVGARHLILRFTNHLNLENAILHMRDFYGANLKNVNFKNAELHFSNLMRSDLQGAIFTNATLDWVKLGATDLRGADLSDIRMMEVDLKEAALSGTNLSGARLMEADLHRAILIGANLSNANLQGANLEYANFTDADLTNADLTGAKLRGANFMNVRLDGATQNGKPFSPPTKKGRKDGDEN